MTTLSDTPQAPHQKSVQTGLWIGRLTSIGGRQSNGRATDFNASKTARWRPRLARYLAIAVVLGAWQGSGAFLSPLFISTPSLAVLAFYHLVVNGTLPTAVGSSIYILAIGIVLSGLIGIGVGLTMGRISLLERALDPLVTFGNATPSIAILPLMEIWFGQGKLSAILFIFVIGLWQMIVNTLSGVRVVRTGYRDVGASFGMGKWEQTWKIYLPAAQPFIFAGARISLAQCTVGMILAQQELGQRGLGGLVDYYGTYFATDKLIAVIAVTCALALSLFTSLRVLQNKKFSWIRATSAGQRGGR